MVELQPHQIKPVEYMKTNNGLIVYHSTGSGKTITSLKAMSGFDKEIIVIGPKSSRKAFQDESERVGIDITFYTYGKIKNKLDEKLDYLMDKCVIVDEAHHLRNETKRNLQLINAFGTCYKIILLTATPIVNHPSDFSVLVNIVKNDVMPTKRDLFDFFYYDQGRMVESELSKKLINAVSFYEFTNSTDYPDVETVWTKVLMDSDQIREYKRYIRMILPNLGGRLDIDFDHLGKKELNAFMTNTRQLSNTVDGKTEAPKMVQIMERIKAGPYPAIVYSNYLNNGLYTLAKSLSSEGIRYNVITGTTSPNKLNQIVEQYNQGQYQVLLISSAGSESLDLKNTRQIHIMEPHWNEAKINQVIGRAVRYKSHAALPEDQRKVTIYRWISIFPGMSSKAQVENREQPLWSGPLGKFRNQSADEYLRDLSNRKLDQINEFKKMIEKYSIEKVVEKSAGQTGGSNGPSAYWQYMNYKMMYLLLSTCRNN